MPALFCLAMMPALRATKSQLPEEDQVLAYLDDIYILSRPIRCREAYSVEYES